MPEDQRIAETIANWLAEQAGAEIAFEKRSSRETSRFCPDREQRELDGLPSRLAR